MSLSKMAESVFCPGPEIPGANCETGPTVELSGAPVAPPIRGTRHAAGYDIYALLPVVIEPDETEIVDTGLRLKMSPGMHAEIRGRSGHARHAQLQVFPGIVDPDYEGSLKVLVRNQGHQPYQVQKQERIAQLIFVPTIHPTFHWDSAAARPTPITSMAVSYTHLTLPTKA